MSTELKCMFDTNVFNRILDGVIHLESLVSHVEAHATHVQRDEINNTRNAERRLALLKIFGEAVAKSVPTNTFVLEVSRFDEARSGNKRVVPTASAVWDVSRWDQASWSPDDNLYSRLKGELDELNGSKPNNIQDALIAETSIRDGYVLVTDDTDLAAVTKRCGAECISVAELFERCVS